MQRPKTQDERDLVLYESRLQRPVRMKTPEFPPGPVRYSSRSTKSPYMAFVPSQPRSARKGGGTAPRSAKAAKGATK